jgi:hypothetical protein
MDRPKMKRVLTILVAILVQNIVQADPTVSGRNNIYLIKSIDNFAVLLFVIYLKN